MKRLLILSMALATPALAEDEAPSTAPQRVRSIVLFGDQACPKAENPDEIVVCSNGGDSPYRIPKNLRERPVTPASTSWVRRAELVDEVNRAVLPGACNPIGSFGQSGCTMQMIQRWKAEQAEQKAKEAAVP
jgi:hypothetical protein